jgi:hypothetical protein
MLRTLRTLVVVVIVIALLPHGLRAESVPFTDARWRIQGEEHEITEFRGQTALYLENGMAVLDEVELLNGTIEFDIAFTADRGFSGARWRIAGPGEAEEFYLRPHQSGNPDANQYTPVFNGSTAWQLYHGPRYSSPIEYDFEGWNHVEIVIRDGVADVYVNSDEPVLHVDELKRKPQAGGLGLVSNLAPAWFSGFSYEIEDEPEIKGSPAPPRLDPPNKVRSWEVSSAFPESLLEGKVALEDVGLEELGWREAEAESTGIINLARWSGVSDEADSVLAKLHLQAEEPVSHPIRLGFSDRVKVFLNGRLLFSGNNGYRSRDYRYLGTIGLFDTVYLPLQKGDNELVLAVSESFGGWGLIADIAEVGGIRLTSSLAAPALRKQ